MSNQLSFLEIDSTPPGFQYLADFISQSEEEELIKIMLGLEFESFEMRGVEAKRKIRHYGVSYNFLNRSVTSGQPIPEWMADIKKKCEDLVQEEIGQALVTRYPAGASIGWHVDAPAFSKLVGISLLNSCRMQLRKGTVRNWEKYEVELQTRSAYVIENEARWGWEHHIPSVLRERYSITFRTLKDGRSL